MAQEGLSAETIRFIHFYFDSISKLEILLLLCGPPALVLSSAQINETLRSNADSVEKRLASLVKQGLIATMEGEPAHYRYAPATEEIARQVEVLAKVYRNFRERVIETIYSPGEPMRNFADAFRLKKDSGNDS